MYRIFLTRKIIKIFLEKFYRIENTLKDILISSEIQQIFVTIEEFTSFFSILMLFVIENI